MRGGGTGAAAALVSRLCVSHAAASSKVAVSKEGESAEFFTSDMIATCMRRVTAVGLRETLLVCDGAIEARRSAVWWMGGGDTPRVPRR